MHLHLAVQEPGVIVPTSRITPESHRGANGVSGVFGKARAIGKITVDEVERLSGNTVLRGERSRIVGAARG